MHVVLIPVLNSAREKMHEDILEFVLRIGMLNYLELLFASSK